MSFSKRELAKLYGKVLKTYDGLFMCFNVSTGCDLEPFQFD